MAQSALILGGTGFVGSHVLKHLLESDSYSSVISVGRSSTGIKHPKLVEHIFDLTEMDRHADLFKADVFVCCLGTTIKKAGSKTQFRLIDYTLPLKASILMKQNGAKSVFLVSSSGADSTSRFFYLQVKGDVERAITEVGFERTLIFRPAGLLGKRNEFRPGEKIGVGVMKLLSPIMIGPLRKNRPIKAENVAYVMTHLPSERISGVRAYESHEIQTLYDSMS